jgi:OFA family oxalate/formate antiporter-like MFS transporter
MLHVGDMQARPTHTLAASMLVTFVLGSVHAFSVFLVPLETLLQLPRSQISLIYSFALVAITLAVTIGYRIYSLLPAWWLVMMTGIIAAAGLWVAAAVGSWWALLVGYSIAFGFANGIGYGYCLQLVGRVMPARQGMAMGAVTASYAVGSIVFAKVFAWRIGVDSVSSAFIFIAVAILAAVTLAAIVMHRAGASYGLSRSGYCQAEVPLDRRRVMQFWLAYMTSVFAGLMAIGHAAGIAQSRAADAELASWAAVTVGVGSALGGFAAGGLVDRWPVNRFLVGLPLLSAVALLCIGATTGVSVTLALLALVGFAYGSIIAIYPVAISVCFGERGAEAYGRVFIAWGLSGLIAPWCAGIIFDLRGGYELAMLIAALVALVSAVCAGLFGLGKTG